MRRCAPEGHVPGSLRPECLFFVSFLGLPLLLYVVIVVWPIGQAIYYSLTDWRDGPCQSSSGWPTTPGCSRTPRSSQALTNNLILMVALPTVVIVLAFARLSRDGRRQHAR